MRQLFTLDMHDYTPGMPVHVRHAVRGLICRDGLWILQQTARGEYKVPGGGVEAGETPEQALIREIREETGLSVRPETIRPIGQVVERRLDRYRDPSRIFEQRSTYYLCQAEETGCQPEMTPAELSWGMHPVWLPLTEAIAQNRALQADSWMVRDTRFMEWLRDTIARNEEVAEQ